MKKKLLLSSVAALTLFAAYNTANASSVTLKPGMVDRLTGKLITATPDNGGTNDATNVDQYVNGKYVQGKTVNDFVPAYSRFGSFDLSTASVKPAAKQGDKSEHFVRVNVVDAKGNPLKGVEVEFEVPGKNGPEFLKSTTDETGSAIVTKPAKVKVNKNNGAEYNGNGYDLNNGTYTETVAGVQEVEAELPVSFAPGSTIKYRLANSHASNGKDVAFVGEFKVSTDLYSDATIVINEVRTTDVTFKGQPATGKTGWVKDNQGWKYEVNSKLVTGWVQDNGKWYFFGQDNLMKKWWVQDNGTWYFLNGAGEMQTGWLQDNGTWYYLEGSGAMKVNQWFEVDGKWYHVEASGALSVNTVVDGYTVNANGEWV